MCGRFAMTLPDDAMAHLFDATLSNDLPPVPRYNVCPTQPVLACTADDGTRRLRPMRWGFIPHWYKSATDGPLLINARAETIAEKPAFRAACRERRCLIPTSGFYEWTKDSDGKRLPWYITRADGAPLVMAGVWQGWTGPDGAQLTTAAVVTTAANDDIAAIHHRMPVTVDADQVGLWLGEAGKGAARLMSGAAPGTFVAHRVDPAVNSNRATGPQLIAAVDP